jgi:predicted transcriptional regulator
LKPRYRQLSHIKQEMNGFDNKSVAKTLHKLKSDDMISLDGDLTHLTKIGISHFNENHKN